MCLSVCCVNTDDEGKSSRMNPIFAGAGQYWGQGTKHHPKSPLLHRSRAQLAKIYSIYIYI